MKLDQKRDETKQQEQKIQTEQKPEPIIRVRSSIRAGLYRSPGEDAAC